MTETDPKSEAALVELHERYLSDENYINTFIDAHQFYETNYPDDYEFRLDTFTWRNFVAGTITLSQKEAYETVARKAAQLFRKRKHEANAG